MICVLLYLWCWGNKHRQNCLLLSASELVVVSAMWLLACIRADHFDFEPSARLNWKHFWLQNKIIDLYRCWQDLLCNVDIYFVTGPYFVMVLPACQAEQLMTLITLCDSIIMPMEFVKSNCNACDKGQKDWLGRVSCTESGPSIPIKNYTRTCVFTLEVF